MIRWVMNCLLLVLSLFNSLLNFNYFNDILWKVSFIKEPFLLQDKINYCYITKHPFIYKLKMYNLKKNFAPLLQLNIIFKRKYQIDKSKNRF